MGDARRFREERRESPPTPNSPSPEGTFRRWTELIRRPGNLRGTLWNAARVLLLVYCFLSAINMMGQGVKTMGENPDYCLPVGEAMEADTDAEIARYLVSPAEMGGPDLVGRRAGAIRNTGPNGGYVGVGDHALRAVTERRLIPAGSCVRITSVEDDVVVVRRVGEYRDWLDTLFEYAHNPFLGLLVGILVTATFQSSSFTTSFTVGLVASVGMDLESAVPVIMGANIGTSVTNLIVCMGYVHRRAEFSKALSAAMVHDLFNVMTVTVLFMLEITTHLLSGMAEQLAGLVYHGGGDGPVPLPPNVAKTACKWPGEGLLWFLDDVLGLSPTAAGAVATVVAVALLFTALTFLVKVLRSMVLARVESFFDRVLFRNAGIAFLVGLILTAAVQSSSVTTSLVVPLTAAGLLTLRQIFPYCLGANIGTTFTTLMAAFATAATTQEEAKVGLTLACTHLLFNVVGAVVFYPLRFIPINLAKWLGHKAAGARGYAIVFLLIIFFGIPLLGILVYHFLSKGAGG